MREEIGVGVPTARKGWLFMRMRDRDENMGHRHRHRLMSHSGTFQALQGRNRKRRAAAANGYREAYEGGAIFRII